jgi:glycosyltransferase involved in cell wall biosynthesis
MRCQSGRLGEIVMRAEGLDVVCFSSNDWDDIPSSKYHIMKYLAIRNRVLFVNTIGIRSPRAVPRDLRRVVHKGRAMVGGLRKVSDSLYVLSPPAIPFHGFAATRAVNNVIVSRSVSAACKKLGMQAPIVWSYVPHAIGIVRRLERGALLYHCIDDYAAVTGAPAASMLELERQMCGDADVVAASSRALAARCRQHSPRTSFVPHGVDVDHFSVRRDAVFLPDIDRLPEPRVGFVGRFGDWIDDELVAAVAALLREWSVVAVGPVIADVSRLSQLPNVHFLGQKPYDAIPHYLQRLDVTIIPYRGLINRETRNPLKLYEYLAAGKPVVATPIAEAERFSDVAAIAATPAAFAAAIQKLHDSDTPDRAAARRERVSSRSWGNVAEEILALLETDRSSHATAPSFRGATR